MGGATVASAQSAAQLLGAISEQVTAAAATSPELRRAVLVGPTLRVSELLRVLDELRGSLSLQDRTDSAALALVGPLVGAEMLALCLEDGHALNAKFLFQREGAALQGGFPEIKAAYEVVKALLRDDAAAFSVAAKSPAAAWSPGTLALVTLLTEQQREQRFAALERLYARVSLPTAARCLGLPEAEAKAIAELRGWKLAAARADEMDAEDMYEPSAPPQPEPEGEGDAGSQLDAGVAKLHDLANKVVLLETRLNVNVPEVLAKEERDAVKRAGAASSSSSSSSSSSANQQGS